MVFPLTMAWSINEWLKYKPLRLFEVFCQAQRLVAAGTRAMSCLALNEDKRHGILERLDVAV